MYRFLASPKWLGFAALMIVASAVMVGLGSWQLDRYHLRHAINLRIDHANATAPVPMADVVRMGAPIPADREWTRVTVTGVYASDDTVVARDRTVDDNVGFEILTPLVLADGSAVVVDRGWIAPGSGGAIRPPAIPAPPAGTVTVTGRVHRPESSPDAPIRVDGDLTVRRIAPASIAGGLGYANLYADYILLDKQAPAAQGGFVRIPADRQPAWMNAGYTVQWWAFALLALVGFGWAARREARDRRDGVVRNNSTRSDNTGIRRSRDRLGEDFPPAGPVTASRADPGVDRGADDALGSDGDRRVVAPQPSSA